jgi:ribosomal protein L31
MASEQAANQLLNNLQNTRQTLDNIQVDLDASEEFNANLIDLLNDKNQEISVKQEAVSQLEDVVVEKAKERQVWASTHAFSMMKLNDEKSTHPFYVIRCQNRRMNGAITKLRRKFPQATVVYQQKKVPNAVNLYTRLKDHKSVKHTHNYCTPTCSEDQLLYLLNSLCGSTYPATNTAPLNSCIRQA